MTYLERKTLALVEHVRGEIHLDQGEVQEIANDALALVGELSKRQKGVLLNVCGDLLSVFPRIKKHLGGSFRDLFVRYEDELLALQVQADRLKREGTYQ
jgi:hypothetical protein